MKAINEITTDTESAVRFCHWFRNSYPALKGSLQVRTESDEDVFHDTFLTIRQRILYKGDIMDYAPYFANAYRNNLTQRKFREGRFVYPDDVFFRTLSLTDENSHDESSERIIYNLASDMMKFVRLHFSKEESELFNLHVMENGFSAKELSCYTGLSAGRIYHTLSIIKKAILKNPAFCLRWKQYLVQTS